MRNWIAALALSLLLAAGCCGLSACSKATEAATSDDDAPVAVSTIRGSDVSQVKVTPATSARLGLKTSAVRAVTASRPRGADPTGMVVPLSAVIYDPAGISWTYTLAGPDTYVRKAVAIARIVRDDAYLTAGPAPGTQVVTVGAAELLGAEFGVGEE